MDGQSTAHFLGSERAAMQAKAVAALLRRKSVLENAGDVFRRNSDPIICNSEIHKALLSWSDTDSNLPVIRAKFVECVFGIADEIDKNLQGLVLVEPHRGNRFKIADHLDSVSRELCGVHDGASRDRSWRLES